MVFILTECYLGSRTKSPVSKEGSPITFSLTKIPRYCLSLEFSPKAEPEMREGFCVLVVFCGTLSQEYECGDYGEQDREERNLSQIEGFSN